MSNSKPFAARAYFYFSLFMIAVYVGTGFMLIFVFKFLQLASINRIGAGCALVLYGVYRTYTLFRKNKSFSSTDSENGSV